MLAKFSQKNFLNDESLNPTKTTKELREYLRKDQFSKKNLNISYRTLNHWSSLGIINDKRIEGSSKWRKFNAIDVTWIKIIEKLRKFGVSIEEIQLVYKKLFTQNDNRTLSNELIESFILKSITGNPCGFIFFDNSDFYFIEFKEVYNAKQKYKTNSFIYIDFNSILFESLNEYYKIEPEYEHVYELDEDDFSMISIVKSGYFQDVRIKIVNEKIVLVKATEKIHNDRRIIDILNSGKFQNINIVQDRGKITGIKRTFRFKFKNTNEK